MSGGDRTLGIRWTIGDVSLLGFEALRLAVWGAVRIFGDAADYTICLNSIEVAEAQRRTGPLPDGVRWRSAAGNFPDWLRPHLDPETLAEGKAWKFDPLHLYLERWELSFDNDCILWALPPSIAAWLRSAPARCLIAADVALAHGAFTPWTGAEPRNSGIRGLPPGIDFEGSIRALLEESRIVLRTELDEQGLQIAAVDRHGPPVVVPVEEVAITSPFPPHLPELGSHGAHFVGLNEKAIPWSHEGTPALDCLRQHWKRHRDELHRRVGIEPWWPDPLDLDSPDVA